MLVPHHHELLVRNLDNTMLTLATPGSSAGGSDGHDESSRRGDAVIRQKLSRDFGFPYESAYGIQIELMQAVFGAIEARKIGVFESPTGTVRAQREKERESDCDLQACLD